MREFTKDLFPGRQLTFAVLSAGSPSFVMSPLERATTLAQIARPRSPLVLLAVVLALASIPDARAATFSVLTLGYGTDGPAACSPTQLEVTFKASVVLSFGSADNTIAPVASKYGVQLKVPGFRSDATIDYAKGQNKATLTTVPSSAFSKTMDVLFYPSFRESPSTGLCADVSGFHEACVDPANVADCKEAAEYVRGGTFALPVKSSVPGKPKGCIFGDDGLLHLNTDAGAGDLRKVYCDCRPEKTASKASYTENSVRSLCAREARVRRA